MTAKSSTTGPDSSALLWPSWPSSRQARMGLTNPGGDHGAWTSTSPTNPDVLADALPVPARPASPTIQKTTWPYRVGTLPPLMNGRPPGIPVAAWTGSSLAAARPGGYRDGAEDATTVPSAAIATTAVTAWLLWIGPVIAGTTSVPSGADRAWPSCAAPGSPSTVPAWTTRRDNAGRAADRNSWRWRPLAPCSSACDWPPSISGTTWKQSTSASTSTTTARVTRM